MSALQVFGVSWKFREFVPWDEYFCSSSGVAPVREGFLGLLDSPVKGLFVACPGA